VACRRMKRRGRHEGAARAVRHAQTWRIFNAGSIGQHLAILSCWAACGTACGLNLYAGNCLPFRLRHGAVRSACGKAGMKPASVDERATMADAECLCCVLGIVYHTGQLLSM